MTLPCINDKKNAIIVYKSQNISETKCCCHRAGDPISDAIPVGRMLKECGGRLWIRFFGFG
jgi:hypothetical protein